MTWNPKRGSIPVIFFLLNKRAYICFFFKFGGEKSFCVPSQVEALHKSCIGELQAANLGFIPRPSIYLPYEPYSKLLNQGLCRDHIGNYYRVY